MIKKIFKLAINYLKYNRLMSIILVVCITISIFIPMFTVRISNLANEILSRRAMETPLVIGRKGGSLQLVLNTLYFKADTPDIMQYSVYEDIAGKNAGRVIPLYNKYTARGYPVIGTTLEYFGLRSLAVRSGSSMQVLGDAVLGFNVSRKLGLGAGDSIITDTGSLYNISSMYPLQMSIVGVLEKSNSPDDNVIFTGIKTTWVIDGIGHGHKDLKKAEDIDILSRDRDNIVGSPSVYEYTRITPENIDSFHFHGDPGRFPLTGIIVIPETARKKTILQANINLSETLQAVTPEGIIGNLMKLVFNVQKILSSYFFLVFLSTVLFLALIITLSLQIRKSERHIMQMIGSSKYTIFFILFTQMFTIVLISFGMSVVAVNVLVAFVKYLQFI